MHPKLEDVQQEDEPPSYLALNISSAYVQENERAIENRDSALRKFMQIHCSPRTEATVLKSTWAICKGNSLTNLGLWWRDRSLLEPSLGMEVGDICLPSFCLASLVLVGTILRTLHLPFWHLLVPPQYYPVALLGSHTSTAMPFLVLHYHKPHLAPPGRGTKPMLVTFHCSPCPTRGCAHFT